MAEQGDKLKRFIQEHQVRWEAWPQCLKEMKESLKELGVTNGR